MIHVEGLTKRFGAHTAVDDISVAVQPGHVTGLLGPNGAGKSTSMRIVMGLVRPTAGRALVNGRPLAAHSDPMRQAGALLDSGRAHPGRSGRDHLRVLAATHRIGTHRVDDLIELTGLAPVAGRRVRGYSLGMRQRLGLAAALLGDPETLVLDEPINGLDPQGVAWLRGFLRELADEGRTVLVASHVMSEIARTVDHVIVIARGRVLADTTLDSLAAGAASTAVRQADAPQAGDLGVEGLERAYLDLTRGQADLVAGPPLRPGPPIPPRTPGSSGDRHDTTRPDGQVVSRG